MPLELDDKVVLVTGGTGSIGSALVKSLLTHNVAKVIVFSRDETKHYIMKRRISDDRLETVVGDIRSYRTVQRVFDRFKTNLVYHVAAMKHVTMSEFFPVEALKTNVIGTQNIVDLTRRYEVQKLVNISTDKAVYPTSVLGATKFIAERIVANAGYTSVRFGNVAGSRGSAIPILIEELLGHKRLTITDLRVTRFMMTIQDAVMLILKATELALGGETFILKMKAFKLADLVEILVNEVGPELGLNPKEVEVKKIGLVSGEKLHEELVACEELENLYELPDMYVLTSSENKALHIGAKRATLCKYTSEDTENLSKDDLAKVVYSVLRSMKNLNKISEDSSS